MERLLDAAVLEELEALVSSTAQVKTEKWVVVVV
jgi:hypothetical protein